MLVPFFFEKKIIFEKWRKSSLKVDDFAFVGKFTRMLNKILDFLSRGINLNPYPWIFGAITGWCSSEPSFYMAQVSFFHAFCRTKFNGCEVRIPQWFLGWTRTSIFYKIQHWNVWWCSLSVYSRHPKIFKFGIRRI